MRIVVWWERWRGVVVFDKSRVVPREIERERERNLGRMEVNADDLC